MTEPSIHMTREAAEMQLTRDLLFRVVPNEQKLERIAFLDDDVATVTATEPASITECMLWRAAADNLQGLGDAEQRERELFVQIKTIADELAADIPYDDDNATSHRTSEMLRKLLPADV